MPANPSHLSPPDLHPVTKIFAEKVIDAIDAAYGTGAAVLRPTPDTVADGDNLPVAGISITPTRTGSKIFVSAVVNGTTGGAAVVSTSLKLNSTTVFGSGGRATVAGIGDVSIPVLGHLSSGPVGTPMAIEVNVAPVGAAITVNGAGVDQGVELMAWEVGGT